MEEKEEIDPIEIQELREMSLLSLSHTPDESFDEIMKIVKNFWGVFFKIEDEYTFSDLEEKIEEFGIDEEVKEELLTLIGKLKKMLYIQQEVKPKDGEFLKEEFLKLVDKMTPERQILAEPKKKPMMDKFTPPHLFHKEQKPLLDIPESIDEKEVTSKPVEEPPIFEKPKPVKGMKDLTKELSSLEKEISKKKNNQFLMLEFESIQGDVELFAIDQTSVNIQDIKGKIETLKRRVAQN